jgi:GAF domain-containing protein
MNEEAFGVAAGPSRAEPGETFAADVREAVNSIDFSDSLKNPIEAAIDKLLELANRAVGSDQASVLVRDGNEGGLRFLTAISPKKDELLKLHVPPGKGIAGAVFSSGQPIAVNDVREEGSFWSEADKKIGFKTISLLATPLRVGYETIGVLEFVNRPGTPPYPPFTPEEMDRAAYFAGIIGRLVDAQAIAELVESLFARSLKAPIGATEETKGPETTTREWLEGVTAAPEHRDLFLLGMTLREIVSRGDAERELCREVLEALMRFSEKRSASTTYFGS